MTTIKYWLRWIAAVPAALLGSILILFPLHWILYIPLRLFVDLYPEFPERLLAPLVTSASFIWIGTKVAPSHKRITTYVLSGVLLICLTSALVFVLTVGRVGDRVFEIGRLPMSFIGLALGFFVSKKQSVRCDPKSDNQGTKSKEVLGDCLVGVLAVVQVILHYLGIIGIILGIVAFIAGNNPRGTELLIGGVGFIVLKYVLGFIVMGLLSLILPKTADSKETKESNSPCLENDEDEFDYGPLHDMAKRYVQITRDYLMYQVVDEKRLPADKSELKATLKLLIDHHRGEEGEELFKHAYLWLSKFQPNVERAENRQRMFIEELNKKLKSDNVDVTEDEWMSTVSESINNILDDEYQELVKTEEKLLGLELGEFDRAYNKMVKAAVKTYKKQNQIK
jgi:hypothetical protein